MLLQTQSNGLVMQTSINSNRMQRPIPAQCSRRSLSCVSSISNGDFRQKDRALQHLPAYSHRAMQQTGAVTATVQAEGVLQKFVYVEQGKLANEAPACF